MSTKTTETRLMVALPWLVAATVLAAGLGCGPQGEGAPAPVVDAGADDIGRMEPDTVSRRETGTVDTTGEVSGDPDGSRAPTTCPTGAEMGDYSGKPTVDVTIDGNTFEFIYDTGAPRTVVDYSVTDEVGSSGPYTVEVAGKSAELGSLPSYDVKRRLGGHDGILGTNFVRNFVLTLDYDRGEFLLFDEFSSDAFAACDHVEHRTTTTDFVLDQYLYVRGRMETIEGWMLVDSGASLGVVVEPVLEELEKEKPRPALQGFYTPAAVTFWAKLTRTGSIEVAGERVTDILSRSAPERVQNRLQFDEDERFLGMVPSAFLDEFLVTFDFDEEKMHLDAYAEASRTDETPAHTVGIGLEETKTPPIEVAQILEGSAAAEADIAEGDRIVSIDGKAVGQMRPYARPWRLLSQTKGTTITVEIDDGTKTQSHDLKTRDLLKAPDR